jgi:hypothetical protein
MWFNVNSVGGAEVDVHFRENSLFIRGYYSEQMADLVKESNNKHELLRLLNYINCNVEFGHIISTPRVYLSTDSQSYFTAPEL